MIKIILKIIWIIINVFSKQEKGRCQSRLFRDERKTRSIWCTKITDSAETELETTLYIGGMLDQSIVVQTAESPDSYMDEKYYLQID